VEITLDLFKGLSHSFRSKGEAIIIPWKLH